MADKKQMIDAEGKFVLNAGNITGHIMCCENGYATVFDRFAKVICKFSLLDAPTVDAVPVDEIIFHHILIDKNGIPEVKLQFGERTLVLRRKDPVDVVEVVRCKDCFADGCCSVQIDLDMGGEGYCPKGKRRNDHGEG